MPSSRRSFLKQVLIGSAAALTIPWMAVPSAWSRTVRDEISGRLDVINAHTDESLSIRYLGGDGNWDREALAELNHLFRCHYNDQVKQIDPGLFVLMDRLRTRLGAAKCPIHLISGYRSPEYNRLLISKGRGVARRSYHLRGMAADIQIEGVSLSRVCREAKRIGKGGVGFYSRFVHVDVGPVRSW
jgi:uncharacterized protein YcbK (DUF882 family)